MSQVLLPKSLEELWSVLADHPGARLYAGGTDLLVQRRQGLIQADTLVCLERLEELARLEESQDELRLGALATHARLLEWEPLARHFPVLVSALSVLGSPPVRHMGTLGGNLVTASPAGDTLPPLYALGARVDLLSARGRRSLAIAEFIQGPGRVDLEPGEVVARVVLKKSPAWNRQHFEKVGQRRALAIAVASLAAVLQVENGRVLRARLAWGSLGPTVVTSPQVEAALEGGPLEPGRLQEAARLAREAVAPISDLRASADYRRRLAGNLLLRLAQPV